MQQVFSSSPLFATMKPEDIEDFMRCSGAVIRNFEKEAVIFHQNETPRFIHVLVQGAVSVCFDTASGKRNVMATFHQPGELFGEVYAFLGKAAYDMYAQASPDATVLFLPKEQFTGHCPKNCNSDCRYQDILISNMLEILANKAFFLNRKLQILSSTTLRQKIAKTILQHPAPDGTLQLSITREAFADYLGVARPSLSRELMKMKKEGMLTLDGKKIIVDDIEKLMQVL